MLRLFRKKEAQNRKREKISDPILDAIESEESAEGTP